MPEHVAMTDPTKQVKEPIGSGPLRFGASARMPEQRVVHMNNDRQVSHDDDAPSCHAGAKNNA